MQRTETLDRLVSAVYRLREATEQISALRFLSEIPQHDVTMLIALAHCGPRTLTELAAERHITRQTMSANLRRLESRGFVSRSNRTVSITEAGREYAETVYAQRCESCSEVAQFFTQVELEQALGVVERITGHVDALIEAARGKHGPGE